MRRNPGSCQVARQHGSVLIISLIMLMVLTLLAISAINMSTTGLRAVNGQQSRAEGIVAAQMTVDQIISGYFVDNIGGIQGATYATSVNGSSYPVVISSLCLKKFTPIRNVDLDLTNATDVKCFDTLSNPYSACSKALWEFSSSVTQGFFGTNVTVNQGVAVKMDTSTATAYQLTGIYDPTTNPSGRVCAAS